MTSTKNTTSPYIETYKFHDILGAEVKDRFLNIYIFSKMYEHLDEIQKQGCCCCKKVQDPKERSLHSISIFCNSNDEAIEWRNRIIQVAYGGEPSLIYLDHVPEKKKILALLNPFGGMGLAPRKWEIAK